MSKANSLKGYAALAVLAVMVIVLLVAIVSSFNSEEQQAPSRSVVVERAPAQEEKPAPAQPAQQDRVWQGAM